MSDAITTFGRMLQECLAWDNGHHPLSTLSDLIDGWTADELDVLGAVFERLRLGRERHGPLDVDAKYGRVGALKTELREELEDSLVYGAMAEVLLLRKAQLRVVE